MKIFKKLRKGKELEKEMPLINLEILINTC
jgi:hypothetical protein